MGRLNIKYNYFIEYIYLHIFVEDGFGVPAFHETLCAVSLYFLMCLIAEYP